jgi:hypothetical protein
MNTEGCADRVADPDAPAQPTLINEQAERARVFAEPEDVSMKAHGRHDTKPAASPTSNAGRAALGQDHRSGSQNDARATTRAFTEVLDACPDCYRARLTPTERDPEDATIYMSEIVALYRTFAPLEPYEWSIVADIGRCAADSARDHRTVTALIQDARRKALTDVLRPILKDRSGPEIDATVDDYLAGRRKGVECVERALAGAGLIADVITARARLQHETSILLLERKIDNADKNKHRLLRDLKADRTTQGVGRSSRPRPAGGSDGRLEPVDTTSAVNHGGVDGG